MKRPLLNFLTMLSLLLCAAVTALWVRSVSVFDHVTWRYQVDVTPAERDERSLHAVSVRGWLFVGRSREQYRPFPPWEGWTQPHPRPGMSRSTLSKRPGWANDELDLLESFRGGPGRRPFGVGVARTWSVTNHGGPIRQFDGIAAPHCLIALALTLPAFFSAARRWRHKRSRRPGMCRHCGYDLRATPDRCPECGQCDG
jgi:hypothetical protein